MEFKSLKYSNILYLLLGELIEIKVIEIKENWRVRI